MNRRDLYAAIDSYVEVRVSRAELDRNKLRRTVLAVAAVYHRYAQGDQSGGAAVDAMERIGAVLRKP